MVTPRTSRFVARLFTAICSAVDPVLAGEPDCNLNGIPDSQDLQGRVVVDLPRSYPSAAVAVSDLAADFDGDGDIDLASLAPTLNYIAVSLNRGDGSYAFPVQYPIGARPIFAAAGDLNGDGFADVVIANRDDDTVWVLRGDGNGALTHSQTINVGDQPILVALGNIDSDSDLDLVVVHSSQSASTPGQVFKNDGLATFSFHTSINATLSSTYLLVVDLTGDNRGDIVITQNSSPVNQLNVLLNNGSGNFTGSTFYPTSGQPVSIAAADVDSDLDTDLAIVQQQANTVTLWRNNGAGGFSAGPVISVGTAPRRATFADLLGDGLDELLINNRTSQTIGIYQRTGPAAFNLVRTVDTVRLSSGIFAPDVDQDGDRDLVVPSGIATYTVHLNRGGATFPALPAWFAHSTTGSATALAAADFNQDLQPDFALITAGTSTMDVLRVFLADGGAYVQSFMFNVGDEVFAVRAANLDGDDDVDLVVPEGQTPQVTVLRNNGDGTFALGGSYPVPVDLLGIELADIDNDDDLDLMAASAGPFQPSTGGGCGCYTGGAVYVFLNNGAGEFAQSQVLDSGMGCAAIAAGFFDDDNLRDLAVANNTSDDIVIHLNLGAGTFGPPTALAPIGTSPFALTVADLDQDGHDDLLCGRVDIADLRSDILGIYRGLGGGMFSPPQFLPGPGGVLDINVADMDRDQDLDIVAASYITDAMYLFANQGDGTFADGEGYWVNSNPFHCEPVHNSNGAVTRIAASVFTGERVVFLENASLPPFSDDEDGNGVPDECEVGLTGDMNCDGALTVSDIAGFVLAVTSWLNGCDAYLLVFPKCDCALADINDDGQVTVSDIGPFVNLLTAS